MSGVNMSYCRFRNTLQALTECESALDQQVNGNEIDDDGDIIRPLDREEKRAAVQLLKTCASILNLATERMVMNAKLQFAGDDFLRAVEQQAEDIINNLREEK